MQRGTSLRRAPPRKMRQLSSILQNFSYLRAGSPIWAFRTHRDGAVPMVGSIAASQRIHRFTTGRSVNRSDHTRALQTVLYLFRINIKMAPAGGYIRDLFKKTRTCGLISQMPMGGRMHAHVPVLARFRACNGCDGCDACCAV